MTKKRYKPPLTSFNPKLKTLLLAATERHIILRSANKSELTTLVARLNLLRLRMQEEKHPDWEKVYGASYRIAKEKEPDGRYALHLYPKDHQFAELLEQANIEMPKIPTDILDDL